MPRHQGDIAEIDGLRGLAIFAVMVHRLWPRDAVNRLSVAADAGWIGVDLFFVVSGFLITRILLETREDPGYFRNFYARRILRIFPLYYLFVGTLLVAFPLMGNSTYLDAAGSPLWYLTFLGNIPEALLGKDPPYWLAPVWSLAIEEQFYLTFPWLVYWLGPQRLGRFLIGLFLLAPVVRLATMLVWPDQERIQYLFTLCRVDAIAAGCLVAVILRWKHAHGLRDLAIIVACCSGAIAIIGDLDRTTDFGRVAGYSFVAIMFGATLVAVMNGLGSWWTAPLRLGPLRYAGRLCFGLYLLHRPADTIVTAVANRFNVDADRISWIPIKIVVALVFATATFHMIEKPFLKFKRLFLSSRHPSAKATGVAAVVLVLTLAGCHAPSPGVTAGADAAVGSRDGGVVLVDGAAMLGDGGVGGNDAAIDAGVVDAGVVDAPPPPPPPPPGHVLYPSNRRHSPITADVVARLQAASTGDAHVFAKVGDSITDTQSFAACFDGGTVDYGAHGSLATSVDHFLQGRISSVTPFVRDSEAARGGWTTADVLEGSPCGLEREVAAATPSVALVLIGTNDNRNGRSFEDYVADLWTTVDQLLASGSVPVLSTLPPMRSYTWADARVPLFNLAIRAIAQGRQVPLVDLYGAFSALPAQGLSSDGIHPTVAPAGACVLTAQGLQYGYNMRNLVTLEALARVRAALAGVASESSAAVRAGDGTAADPFRMPLPVADIGDTRDGELVDVCGDDVRGVRYEIAVPTARTVEVRAVGRAESIAIVASGSCVAQGLREVSAQLPAGTAHVIISGGTGEFVVVVR